ncbi:MAG TPA: tape measure protein, partial [Blastocatellia bacterium]|nr:tape measure protein [Blastocatellia bacterium]
MPNRFVAFTLQLLTGNSKAEAGKLREELKGVGKEIGASLGPQAQAGARSLDQAMRDIAKDAANAKDAVAQFNRELRTNKSLAQEISNSRRIAANQQALSARIAPAAPISATGVGQGLQSAGLAGSGLSALLVGLGSTSIQASGSIESVTRAFKQLDGSRSDETLARLRKQADELKVSFVGYAEQVNKVRATQKLSASESENLVQGLVNIARAVGASRDAQERAVAGLNQLLSKNKIEAEDLKGQIIENIPNLAPIIEKKFGTLDAEILEKKFGAKKFVSGLIQELSRLEKLQPTGLERFQAQLDNLGNKFAPLGDRILELLNNNLDPLLNSVTKAIDAFSSLDKSTQQNIVQFGALAVATGPVLFAFGSLVQAGAGLAGVTRTIIGMTSATTALSGASSGLAGILGGGLNPAVLAVTGAVIAGTVVWFEYRRQIGESIAAIDSAAAKARRAAGEVEFLNAKEITVNTPTIEGLKLTQFGDQDKLSLGASAKVQGLRLNKAGSLTRKTEEQENQEEIKKTVKPAAKAGGSKAKELSELEQLQKQLKEVSKDLVGFQNLGSQEFKLRLELEDKRNLKNELESILKLRRALGEPVAVALPQDLKGVNQEKERLNALKELRELPKIDPLTVVGESARAAAQATAEQVQALDRLIKESLPEARNLTVAQALAQNELFQALQKTNPALAEQFTRQAQAADATLRNTAAADQFKSLQEQLNGQLEQFQNLNTRQALALKLQGDAYKDLTEAQREELLSLAGQVDQQNEFQKQLEESQRRTQEFANGLRGIFDRVLDGPKAFFDNLKNTLKRTLSQMLSDMLTSQALKLLGIVPGGQGQSGGILGGGAQAQSQPGVSGLASTLAGAITGGGQSGSPGGAGGVLTGGFAGGNPANQILRGATQSGSVVNSLLGNIPGVAKFLRPASTAGKPDSTGGSGKIGDLPFGDTSKLVNKIPLRAPGEGELSAAGNLIKSSKATSFLSKIPGLGKLFGGGATAAAGAAGAGGTGASAGV